MKRPESFKREVVRLWRSKQMTQGEIVAKKKLSSGLIYKWAKLYPEEGATPSTPANGSPSTSLVVPQSRTASGKRIYTEADKKKVYALIDKSGKSIRQAAESIGVPVGTVYGWRSSDKKKGGGALVKKQPVEIEAERIESPGVTMVIKAAEKAHTLLKNAQLMKMDAIRKNRVSGNPFPKDFCLGQLAYDELAEVFGTK